jgi:hypothetical protein
VHKAGGAARRDRLAPFLRQKRDHRARGALKFRDLVGISAVSPIVKDHVRLRVTLHRNGAKRGDHRAQCLRQHRRAADSSDAHIGQRQRRRFRLGRLQRQLHPKHTAKAGPADQPRLPAHGAREFTHYRKPKTRPAMPARNAGLGMRKLLKDHS